MTTRRPPDLVCCIGLKCTVSICRGVVAFEVKLTSDANALNNERLTPAHSGPDPRETSHIVVLFLCCAERARREGIMYTVYSVVFQKSGIQDDNTSLHSDRAAFFFRGQEKRKRLCRLQKKGKRRIRMQRDKSFRS